MCRPGSDQNAESPNLLPCCAAQFVDGTIFARILIHAVSCSCFLLCARRVFYNSIPSPVFVPIFIISVMAAIVASQVTNSDTCATPWRQNLSTCHMPPGALCTRTHSFTSCPTCCCCCPAAFGAVHLLLLPNCCTTCPLPHPLWLALITGAFSIVWQSMALGCFPRLRVRHTSDTVSGQVYIAAINWMLLVLCIAVVAGFRSGTVIGNAYGESGTGVAVELPADEVLQLSW